MTTYETIIGSKLRGPRKILKRDRDTKATSGARIWSLFVVTYTANVTMVTCINHIIIYLQSAPI